jgi:outer membrane immunogenic protein
VASFVFGFEGDASWVGEYGSHQDNNGADVPPPAPPGPSPFASVNFRSFTQENWLATVRGRAGYAVDNLLFYVTGGYAAAGVEAGIKEAATSATIVSATSTRSGWTGGGGIEWGFAHNWSAKFEWLFVKFEDKGFVTHLGDGTRSAVTLDDNVVRFGINYRFGGYGGPVVARY